MWAAMVSFNLEGKFWELTPNQRRKICADLGLSEPGDENLPEPRRYLYVFKRAAKRGLTEMLKVAVREVMP